MPSFPEDLPSQVGGGYIASLELPEMWWTGQTLVLSGNNGINEKNGYHYIILGIPDIPCISHVSNSTNHGRKSQSKGNIAPILQGQYRVLVISTGKEL
jgi:hypothetical protein